uniref:Uncharacterized protein n=1 Tax=Mycena chlorophos TaxID=658473 RepID=A0ABQ0LFB6_MYCCL|nr:predicted protein [Mycena chlorophos]
MSTRPFYRIGAATAAATYAVLLDCPHASQHGDSLTVNLSVASELTSASHPDDQMDGLNLRPCLGNLIVVKLDHRGPPSHRRPLADLDAPAGDEAATPELHYPIVDLLPSSDRAATHALRLWLYMISGNQMGYWLELYGTSAWKAALFQTNARPTLGKITADN